MYTVETVVTLEDDRLEPYLTLKYSLKHRERGIFVAEGKKVIQRMLEQPSIEVVSLLIESRWLDEFKPLLDQRKESIQVFLADREKLKDMTGFHLFQGALAIGKVPPSPKLEEILSHAPRPWFFVAIEAINNAINTGVILRNCAAFGAQAFFSSETASSPWLRRSVRNSMGAIFHLPVLEVDCLANTLHQLKKNGVCCLAAHPHTDDVAVFDADLKKDICVVLGNEGSGLSPEILGLCDQAVVIPMNPEIDSLNVGTASGVFLYEVLRQRRLI